MQHWPAAGLGQGGPGLTLTVTAGQAESGAGAGARFQGHCVSGLTRGPGHKNNTRRYPQMSSDTKIPALFFALYPTGGSKSSKLAHIIFTVKFETLQAKSWRDTHIRNSSYLSSNLVISGQ